MGNGNNAGIQIQTTAIPLILNLIMVNVALIYVRVAFLHIESTAKSCSIAGHMAVDDVKLRMGSISAAATRSMVVKEFGVA